MGFWQRNNKTLVHKTTKNFWTKNIFPTYLPTLLFTDCVTGNSTFFFGWPYALRTTMLLGADGGSLALEKATRVEGQLQYKTRLECTR